MKLTDTEVMNMARIAPSPFTHRIRRCSGNRKAWLLATLRPDGTELASHGSYWTAMDVEHLMIRAAAHIGPEARIEYLAQRNPWPRTLRGFGAL